ncbi:hypothetical protein DU80_06980 [Methanosarcina mazei]|uniref:Uncharacterized protein n=1 Tax=Methanosarcina mazei TaxID=2209 RepID=A0A0F8JDZ2_METMZ|nr:hypothetical protein DU47_12760 [Methanosarcina mazei]KKG13386.1 hypothetical protein DU34_06600 [Methanosarcina mazei]KKG28891.1 hypothetical protein DU52_12340 [Methanosarcina mazei]KKG31049.1 hypothetical protein DU49_04315 [Methanosarcina mazei]KKG36925.1 hypothetical protein DU30_12970 [Methanosarcina mazei]
MIFNVDLPGMLTFDNHKILGLVRDLLISSKIDHVTFPEDLDQKLHFSLHLSFFALQLMPEF